MANISGVGLRITIQASISFPLGFTVTQFADDADPLDIPTIAIGDSATGLNGDQLTWSTPKPIRWTLNVIADSNDDLNLSILFNNNRAGRNKIVANDVLTAIFTYPDGTVKTLTGGAIVEGAPATSVRSSGRKGSKAYTFSFENSIGF